MPTPLPHDTETTAEGAATAARPSPPMPERIARLRRDAGGLPIPWFVADDRPLATKRQRAISANLCWLCGETMGIYRSFIVGAVGALTRTCSVPPSHLDCAIYAVQASHFMAHGAAPPNPLPDPDGRAVDSRVHLVWSTNRPELIGIHGRATFNIGQWTTVSWWRDGRAATYDEGHAALNGALPPLVAAAEREGAAAAQDLMASLMRLHRSLPLMLADVTPPPASATASD